MTAAEAPVAASTVPLLVQIIADPESGVAEVAEVVGSDAGLAARVLAVANSAAFGLSRQVTEIAQAVSMVGADLAQTLAIAGSTDLLDGSSGLPHVRHHAISTACAARVLARRLDLSPADAFAAGLLHDLGEILLWRREPDAYSAAHACWGDTAAQLRWERGMFDDHASVARAQLAEWRLPGAIIDAVGDHHRPDLHHRDLSTVVAMAETLVDGGDDDGVVARLAALGVGVEEIDGLRAAITEDTAEMESLLGGP